MSKLTLVHKDDALHLYWHEEHRYYLADWQPVFRKGDALRSSYHACIAAARVHRGAPWIADVSKVPVLDQADQAWIADWFWPEFVKAGVRYQAGVRAEKAVGKLSTQNAGKGIAKVGLEMSVHETRAQAEAAVIAWHEKRANE